MIKYLIACTVSLLMFSSPGMAFEPHQPDFRGSAPSCCYFGNTARCPAGTYPCKKTGIPKRR